MQSSNERSRWVGLLWPVLLAAFSLAAGYGARGAEGAELERRVSVLEKDAGRVTDLTTEVAALRASTDAQFAAVLRELERLHAQLASPTR